MVCTCLHWQTWPGWFIWLVQTETTILRTFQSTILMQTRIAFMGKKQSTMCRDSCTCILTCMPTSLEFVIFLDIRKRKTLTIFTPAYQVKSVRQVAQYLCNYELFCQLLAFWKLNQSSLCAYIQHIFTFFDWPGFEGNSDHRIGDVECEVYAWWCLIVLDCAWLCYDVWGK